MSLALRRRSRSVRQTPILGQGVGERANDDEQQGRAQDRQEAFVADGNLSAFANLSNMRNAESTSRVSAKGNRSFVDTRPQSAEGPRPIRS